MFKVFQIVSTAFLVSIFLIESSVARGFSKKVSLKQSMLVTATAYNSLPSQTDSTPNIAAWGDRLRPGMKVIAVSRDLLKKYGMKHGTKVKIRGLPGRYTVLDKMNKRWRKKIDIYMGNSRNDAMQWGKRKVKIQWHTAR